MLRGLAPLVDVGLDYHPGTARAHAVGRRGAAPEAGGLSAEAAKQQHGQPPEGGAQRARCSSSTSPPRACTSTTSPADAQLAKLLEAGHSVVIIEQQPGCDPLGGLAHRPGPGGRRGRPAHCHGHAARRETAGAFRTIIMGVAIAENEAAMDRPAAQVEEPPAAEVMQRCRAAAQAARPSRSSTPAEHNRARCRWTSRAASSTVVTGVRQRQVHAFSTSLQ